jgi:effector-binding domain-containing protein
VGTDNNITDNSAGANTSAFVDTSVAGEITVDSFTVPAGETATITFDATVN